MWKWFEQRDKMKRNETKRNEMKERNGKEIKAKKSSWISENMRTLSNGQRSNCGQLRSVNSDHHSFKVDIFSHQSSIKYESSNWKYILMTLHTKRNLVMMSINLNLNLKLVKDLNLIVIDDEWWMRYWKAKWKRIWEKEK
jgi:hypothetical protein